MKRYLPILIILLFITSVNVTIFTHFQCELADRDRRIEQLEKVGAKIETVNKVFSQAQKIKKHIQKRSKLSTTMAEDVTYSIIYESRCNGLEPELVTALIDTESRFNPLARSPKGACGLMQLMPGTFQAYGGGDIWDIQDNLSAGCQYLSDLKSRFKDDYVTYLAAYNSGPSRKRAEIIRLAGNYPGKVNRCWRSIRR